MTDQANRLRGLMDLHCEPAETRSSSDETSRACTLSVTSGKGGVGKSNIALNLAIALAELDCKVCLLDANLGLGNIDLLCGLNGYWNLSHVITGARRLQEIMLAGPGNVGVIPGASGLSDLADCSHAAQQDIFNQLEELEQSHDFIIVDTGAGIHRVVREFLTAANLVLIVTTPEPTSIADAYATIKSLSGAKIPLLQAVVNQAESAGQAHAIIERIQQTAKSFLRTEVASAGYIPFDRHVSDSVCRRSPFLVEHPQCPASQAVQKLARRIKSVTTARDSHDAFFPHIRDRLIPQGV